MLRSRGLGRLMNPRRIPLTLGTAVSVAFAAALIGLAPAARADTEPDPFEDLFGTSGINTWTAVTDSSLVSSDPTLAGSLDTSVDNFLASAAISPNFPEGDDPFSFVVWELDPSAFSAYPLDGGLPDNAIGDFAVGLDYALFASGIGGNDVGIADLLNSVMSIPSYIGGLVFLLDLIFAG
jgi:hypothetical protein